MKLKFGKGNSKLANKVCTFSIPAGTTCPGALDCRARAEIKSGKTSIVDYPTTKFRCFAATDEARYPATFAARKFNLDLLRSSKDMVELIHSSLPRKATHVRIHVSGDFFSQKYFDAWLRVAELNPTVLFYAYTKSIPFWVARIGKIPENLILTASKGGRYDSLVTQYDLKYSVVAYSEDEAKLAGLPIDHDDTHAMIKEGNFALLLHGIQPKGSKAAEAMKVLSGNTYNKNNRKAITLPMIKSEVHNALSI